MIDGQEGIVQFWIEGVKIDVVLIQLLGFELGNVGLWYLQKQVMFVFDNLVYNFDWYQNNMFFDCDQCFWFIDYMCLFCGCFELLGCDKIVVIDVSLFEMLCLVDEKQICEMLLLYFNCIEIDVVVKCKCMLVCCFDKLFVECGEQGVFYDFVQVIQEF